MNRLSVICAAIFACLTLTLTTATAGAAGHWGDLDPSFGTDGVSRPSARGFDFGNFTSIAVQPDGKILVGGTAGYSSGGSPYAIVLRLLPNGVLDTSFGGDGIYLYGSSHAGDIDGVESIKLQADGKIVAVGRFDGFGGWGQGSLIFRLNSNGTLDTDSDITPSSCFGPACSGRIEESLGSGQSQFSDVALQPSGDIVAIGGYLDEDGNARLLVRGYDGSGTPNTTFNANAAAATASHVLADFDRNVRVDPYGTYFSVAFSSKAKQFVHLVLTGEGSTMGITSSFGTDVTFNDAIVRPGLATFAGSTEFNGSTALTLAQLDTLGVESYGPIARDVTPGNASSATALAAYPGKRVIALGVSESSAPSPFVTTSVVESNGAPLLDYGTYGTNTYPALGASATADAIELLSNGKAIFVGTALREGKMVPYVSRILGPDAGTTGPKPAATSKISSPLNSTIKAKKLQKFRGTAGPSGQIARVEIALQRVDKRLLKRERHCLWLRSSRAKFTKNRSQRGKCLSPRWLRVNGTDTWSFSLMKALPKGNYVLHVRATTKDGVPQAQPTLKHFTVT
ncbi:MAG: delta-60 repeat domain-containing protein [Thermoleophilaceae bacterium]|nr:delta-60 repeat domain-containing protein [Thermoleophilaceae bacterium]